MDLTLRRNSMTIVRTEMNKNVQKMATNVNRKLVQGGVSTRHITGVFSNVQDQINRNRGPRVESRKQIKEILLYIVFIVIFNYTTMPNGSDQDVFYFGDNVRKQFVEHEFLAEHAPTWNKAFKDVATWEEYYQWLQGPFLRAAYSPATYDGMRLLNGTVLGYGRVVGAIRIGQVRAAKRRCPVNHLSDMFLNEDESEYQWWCYGSDQGKFSLQYEDKEDFGEMGEGEPQYSWRGWNGTDTAAERGRSRFSSYTTKRQGNTYPSPAYAVLFPNHGLAHATGLVQSLRAHKYIDLQTKAVFVDLTLYNPMLDMLCAVRLVAEGTSCGGVFPSYDVKVIRPYEYWSLSFDNATQRLRFACELAVAAFYIYFMAHEAKKLMKYKFGYLRKLGNYLQNLNLLLFAVVWGYRLTALSLMPDDIVVDTDAYVDLRPALEAFDISRVFNSYNTFLVWFKVISFLSFAPRFALLTGTLRRAQEGLLSFSVVFIIIFYGFAQAHLMAFGTKSEAFRDLGYTCYALLNSLLGSFDFDELQALEPLVGPLYFIGFIGLAVFVVLNMLIAIISDAFTDVKISLGEQEDVEVGREMVEYVLDQAERVPLLGVVVVLARRMGEEAVTRLKSFGEEIKDDDSSSSSSGPPDARSEGTTPSGEERAAAADNSGAPQEGKARGGGGGDDDVGDMRLESVRLSSTN